MSGYSRLFGLLGAMGAGNIRPAFSPITDPR